MVSIAPSSITVFVSPNNPAASELFMSGFILPIIPYEIALGICLLLVGGRLAGD